MNIWIIYHTLIYTIYECIYMGLAYEVLCQQPSRFQEPTVTPQWAAQTVPTFTNKVIPNRVSYPKNRWKKVADLQNQNRQNTTFWLYMNSIEFVFLYFVSLVLCKHCNLETKTRISLRFIKSPHHHRPKLLGTAGIPAALLLSHSGQAYRRLFYFHQVRFATLFLN